jgi:hypothetical protein
MLRRVALVRTDVSEELSASIIRVTRIGELRTTLAVTSNWRTLRRNTKRSSWPVAGPSDANWLLGSSPALNTRTLTSVPSCAVALVEVVFLRDVRQLLVTASVVPCSPIVVTLMKEALGSSETSVLTRATQRNIPKDTILHSHRRENLKSYEAYFLCPCNYDTATYWVRQGSPAVVLQVIIAIHKPWGL